MKKILKSIAIVAGSFLYNLLKKKNIIKATSETEAQLIALLNYYGVKFDYDAWQRLQVKLQLVLDDLRDIKEYFEDPSAEHEFNNMRLWLYSLRNLSVEQVTRLYLEAQCSTPVYMEAKQAFFYNASEIAKKKNV